MCPKNIEGSMYALIMSCLNFGSIMGGLLGSLVMIMMAIDENNFDNLWIFNVLSNSISLIPLLLLNMINI